jgi:hypothetical protein
METETRRKAKVREGCRMQPECELRFKALERDVEDHKLSLYGNGERESMATRMKLVEEAHARTEGTLAAMKNDFDALLKDMKREFTEAVGSIRKGMDEHEKQKTQAKTAIWVAALSAITAMLCSVLSVVGTVYVARMQTAPEPARDSAPAAAAASAQVPAEKGGA